GAARAGRPARRTRVHYYARKGGFAIQALHRWRACPLCWIEQPSHLDPLERRCRVYFGSGGLLIVLGIIALVLGYTLIGIILIILGVCAGGFGFYGSRRAP